MAAPVEIDGQIDASAIIAAFNRIQFQSVSLNTRFSGLVQQENDLRLLCSGLHAQLHYLIQEASCYPAPLSPLSLPSPSNPVLSKEALVWVGKQARQSENFSARLMLCFQEMLHRVFSYLNFISNYAGAQPEGLSDLRSIIMLERENSPVPDKSPSLSRVKLRRKRSIASLFERTAEESDEKSEIFQFAAIVRLKDDLMQRFPRQEQLVEAVLAKAVEILPIRIAGDVTSSKEYSQKMKEIKGNGRKSVLEIVSLLVNEGNEAVQTKAEDLFKALRQVFASIKAAHQDTETQLAAIRLTELQGKVLISHHDWLVKAADGPFLSDLPEKLREKLRGALDVRMRSLPHKRATSLPEEDANRLKTAVTEGKKYPAEAAKTVKDEEEGEREELEMLFRERRRRRQGACSAEKELRRDFVPEKISKLSSIRRSADLEKKLLEQVQGIEIKLKTIKSRERELTQPRQRPRLPALHPTSSLKSLLLAS